MLIGETVRDVHRLEHAASVNCDSAFYRARLKRFREAYNSREFGSLSLLEVDSHLFSAGAGMSDSTRHHDAVALERFQKFALQHNLIEKPVFGILEKPRVGGRDRIPTPDETEALLANASPEFRLSATCIWTRKSWRSVDHDVCDLPIVAYQRCIVNQFRPNPVFADTFVKPPRCRMRDHRCQWQRQLILYQLFRESYLCPR